MLLRVTGRNFCAGIVFKKKGNKWIVVDAAPILRKILRNVKIKDFPRKLKSIGATWEWIK